MKSILYEPTLRRENYGRRFNTMNHSTGCILVALDLLVPLHWTGQEEKGGIQVVRKLVQKDGAWHISHSFFADGRYQGGNFILEYGPQIAEGLLRHGLVEPEFPLKAFPSEVETYVATARGQYRLRELLFEHDEMHVGDTLQLHPGEYRHFRYDDRYRVYWVTSHTLTSVLDVCYEPLCGPRRGEKFHIPLAEFTRVIYRPDIGNHLGHRFRLWCNYGS